MADFLQVFWTVVQAVLALFLEISFGVVLAKMQVLNKQINSVISRIIVNVLVPALLFVKIGGSFSQAEMGRAWVMILVSVIHVIVGVLLGWLAMCVTRPPRTFKQGVIWAVSINNTTFFTLSFVKSMATVLPYSADATSYDRGVGYVSLYLIPVMVFQWSFVYYYIEREHIHSQSGMSGVEVAPSPEPAKMDSSSSHESAVSDATSERSSSVSTSYSREETEAAAAVPEPVDDRPLGRCARCRARHPRLVFVLQKVGCPRSFWQTFTINVIATIVGVVVSVIPEVQAVFFARDAPLKLINNALSDLGGAAVPMAMLVLGGELYAGWLAGAKYLGLRTIIGICFTRLLVMPALTGWLLVYLFYLAGLVSAANHIMVLVIVVNSATPSAQLLVAMYSLLGKRSQDMAALLFWQYVAAIPVLAGSVSLLLYLLMP